MKNSRRNFLKGAVAVTALSPLGASSVKRWIDCPGSVALKEEPAPSANAQIGEMVHNFSEFYYPRADQVLEGVQYTFDGRSLTGKLGV